MMNARAGAGTLQPAVIDNGDGTQSPVVSAITSNITGKFRESFETYDPINGQKWAETKAAGDLVYVDGNAVASSYLVISKNPLAAGTETAIETVESYGMPIELAFGASMSQRTLGQEFSVELVSNQAHLPDVMDLEITSITQTTTVLAVTTAEAHGLSVGKSIGILGCSNPVANYPALVVASVPSPTQFTCTAGPGGTIASQTITEPAGAKGYVFFRERLGRARNGASQIFENATVTNASLYTRSESGDAFPSGTVAGSHSTTVGTTAPVQLVNSAYTYAFAPTTEFRINLQADRAQWYDSAVDAVAQTASRLLRTQVCPQPEHDYKLRIRATNNKSLTVPSAQIVSAVKAGTTTATITTATPHGLVLNDPVVVYGIRAQGATEFPNLVTATAVASVVDATTFTIVIGTAGTVTSYGGFVAKVHGGNLMSALGANAVVAQSAVLSTLADGTRQLVLTGNTTWAGLSIGDMAEVVGLREAAAGATLSCDGPWKVANVVTTALTLVLPFSGQRSLPADFGSTNCGGGVIKRTCLRLSFVRLFDYERQRVELLARPTGDISAAAPVAVQNTPAVTMTSTTVAGTTAVDAALPSPVAIGGRASNANITAMSAAGDLVAQLMTMIGAAVNKPYSLPETDFNVALTITGNTAVDIQAAGGAGIKKYLTAFQYQNTNATATTFALRQGTTVLANFSAPASMAAPVDIVFPTPLQTAANATLNIIAATTGANLLVNAQGYTAP